MEKIFFPPPVVNMDTSLVTVGVCFQDKIAIVTHSEFPNERTLLGVIEDLDKTQGIGIWYDGTGYDATPKEILWTVIKHWEPHSFASSKPNQVAPATDATLASVCGNGGQ
eukprot:1091132-Karenia_brevis.AAC.1